MRAARVILAGFMGTGKTEVGRRLARSLGWTFVDTDALVESATGRSVSALFAEEGEPVFRAREREAVAQACILNATVVAVGGGALLDPENRRRLLAAGPVVCLRASPRELVRRLGTARDRPLLNGDGTASEQERLARIESLLARARAGLRAGDACGGHRRAVARRGRRARAGARPGAGRRG